MRFPLYAKILALLFVNLVLIAGVIFFFAQGQMRFGLDYLLAGRAGERVQAVAQVISQEFSGSPRTKWPETLERFAAAYGLEFHLVRGDASPALDNAATLPPEVARRAREMAGPPQFGRPPGWSPGDPRPPQPGEPGERTPPPRDDMEPPTLRDAQRPEGARFGPPSGPDGFREELRARPGEPQSRFLRPGGPRSPFPKAMLRTDDPRRYWVLVRLPVIERDRQRGGPMALVIESPNLGGNGLLFDFKPWLYAGCVAVVVSLLLWFPLVRGITRSLSRMTHATSQIAEGRLDARVELRRHDELGSLADAINGMAARLEGFVGGQKRFLGDTAHELCAPIARIQMALGILEQRADETQRDYVDDLREEVQHMSALVNELLSFSKASLRQKQLQLEPVDLNAMAQRVVAREADDGASVKVNIPDGLSALAEPELLSRAVANLVRNALRYAGDAGPIEVGARVVEGGVELIVGDHGPGVPAEALDKIFDPFYRLDASRNRETGGVGLGLAIVKTCVEACQAKVSARNRQPQGLEVVLLLKAAPAPAAVC